MGATPRRDRKRLFRDALTYRLRVLLERSPRHYQRYQLWRGAHLTPIRPGTKLVISGYPGSGNSYVRAALLFTNPGLRIASHGHTWGEVAHGVERALPVLFLMRDARAAISSGATRYGGDWPLGRALREYAAMYERVYAYRDSVVVASFEEATTATGAVVRRINDTFGTSFVPIDDNDPGVRAEVLRRVQAHDAEVMGIEAELRGAAPSLARDKAKSAILAELEQPKFGKLVGRCDQAYARLYALRL